MNEQPSNLSHPSLPVRRLARITFLSFLFTFIASRVLVILIMLRRIPDFFLHSRHGTHIHHLNYGIFLLAAVGSLLIFVERPGNRLRQIAALLYGCGMALTFDEFGMWLHLGGSYWQRASFDAVIVLLSLFGVIAFAPKLSRMRSLHWTTAAITLLAVVAFYLFLFSSIKYVGQRVGPKLIDIEEAGPQ